MSGDTLTALYQEKVAQGRQRSAQHASGQLSVLKELKRVIDDINENDPFLEVGVSKPSQQSDKGEYLNIQVREDGQRALTLEVRLAKDKDNENDFRSAIPFYLSGKNEVAFEIGEHLLSDPDVLKNAVMEGLASALASRALKDQPKNLPESKRNRIFGLD